MVLKINLPPVVVKRAGRQSHLTIKITTCPRMFLKSLNSSKKRPQKRTSMDNGTPVTPRLYGSVRYGSPSTWMVTDGRAGSTCKKPTVLNNGLRCTEYSQLSTFSLWRFKYCSFSFSFTLSTLWPFYIPWIQSPNYRETGRMWKCIVFSAPH